MTTTAAPFTLANKNALILDKQKMMSSMSLFENDDSHNIVKKIIQTRIDEIDQWLQEFDKIKLNNNIRG